MKSIDRFFVFLMLFAGCLMAVCCEKPVQAEPDDPDNPPVDTTGTTPVPEPDSSYVDIVQDVLYLLRKESMALEIDTCGASAAPVWASSDESVATVSSEGLVRAVAPGKAAISVACGDLYDECPVTVFYGDKKPENAYVGDYYLSDGSILGQNAAPSEIRAADVIGVVYSTDLSRMGEAEQQALRDKGVEPHGFVMASRSVKTITYSNMWFYDAATQGYDRDETEIGIPNAYVVDDMYASYELSDADIDGYLYNKLIREERAEDFANGMYPIFKDAYEFNNTVPAPQTSTGWYLPSTGQWFDILRNLAGATLNTTSSFNDGDYGNFFWVGKGDVPELMNANLEKISDDCKTLFDATTNQLWTSSQASSNQARVIIFDNASFIYSYWYYKFYYFGARCVLGF